MKVILSRKGFDSTRDKKTKAFAYGGIPSPIIDNKILLSLPIPTAEEKYGVKFSKLIYNNKPYSTIINELNYHKPLVSTKCHLDPDIRKNIGIKRNKGWKALFGQDDRAQAHLENNGVKENDLFLFFGWFKKTVDGKFHYTEEKFEEKHLIFGYLQIGQIFKGKKEINKLPKKWQYHPHYKNKDIYPQNNCIYVASDKLSLIPGLPGAGCFRYHEDLVLTKENHPKSHWNLPLFFKEQNIKLSRQIKKPWKGNYFDANSGPGQEFVIQPAIEDSKELKAWVKNIILAGTKAK